MRNEGIRGSHARASSSGGVPLMRTVTEARFRRSPWGRKKHLLPLPILSVVLMVTAMASPGLLRMTVVVFDDSNLTISASIQHVVHAPDVRSGPRSVFVYPVEGLHRVGGLDLRAERRLEHSRRVQLGPPTSIASAFPSGDPT